MGRIRDIEDELSEVEDALVFLAAAAECEEAEEAEREAQARRDAETYLATTFPRSLAKAKTVAAVRALEEEHTRFVANGDQPAFWKAVARKCAKQAGARIRELERAQRKEEGAAAKRRHKEAEARVASLKREADAAEKRKLAAQKVTLQAQKARLRDERAALAAERREIEAMRRAERASQRTVPPSFPAAPPRKAPVPSARPQAQPLAPVPARPQMRRGAASAPLTGADLRAWRTGQGLNQVEAASKLGVTQGSISKAEGTPGKALGPALQQALRGAFG